MKRTHTCKEHSFAKSKIISSFENFYLWIVQLIEWHYLMIYIYSILANYGGLASESCNYPLVTYLPEWLIHSCTVLCLRLLASHLHIGFPLNSLLRRRSSCSSRNLLPVREEERLRRTAPEIWHLIFRNATIVGVYLIRVDYMAWLD